MNVEGVTITSVGGVTSFVPCDVGKTSDGYHTFDELYEHRCLLFCALLKVYPGWKSWEHNDGSSMDGWFVAGCEVGGKQITYHLPNELWGYCHAEILPMAPEWDGHSSADVLARFREWL